jgi:hypothetical protein
VHTREWIAVAHSLAEPDFLTRYWGYFLLSSERLDELSTPCDTEIIDVDAARAARCAPTLEVRWIGFPQDLEYVTVGRDGSRDIVFRTPGMSKWHAEFRTHGNTLTVTDLGSRNGTRVNDKLLAPGRAEQVSVHDRIQFSTVQSMLVDAHELHPLLSRLQ